MKICLLLPVLSILLGSRSVSAQEIPANADGNTSAQQAKPQLDDYPRPMLMRPDWTNLNGEWEFAFGDKDAIEQTPKIWRGKTAVPVDTRGPSTNPASAIDASQRIWYRRQIKTPVLQAGRKLVLHCNGVSTDALVVVNGTLIGMHSGADTPFHTDITELLTKTPTQEIAISAWSADPKTTPTGITREVWLEVIPRSHISSLKITTEPATGKVTVHAKIWGQANFRTLEVRALDGENEVAAGSAHYHYKKGGYETTLTVPEPKLWSPNSPKIYGLRIRLANEDKTTHDDVTSYFALRKVANVNDHGITRFALNGRALFLLGIEDQADHAELSDREIRSQLESIKNRGYNLIHKKDGLDSPRLYHWADRLGLIIWQDLRIPTEEEKESKGFEETLGAIKSRYLTHPSIAIWPADYFPAEKLYTAGIDQADMITTPGFGTPDNPTTATAAVGITGKPSDHEKALEKQKAKGLSAAIFTEK